MMRNPQVKTVVYFGLVLLGLEINLAANSLIPQKKQSVDLPR